MKLLRPSCGLWYDFETRILGVPATQTVRPTFAQRRQAEVAWVVSRLANLLGVKVGNGGLQKTVALYRSRPPSQEGARRELFGTSA